MISRYRRRAGHRDRLVVDQRASHPDGRPRRGGRQRQRAADRATSRSRSICPTGPVTDSRSPQSTFIRTTTATWPRTERTWRSSCLQGRLARHGRTLRHLSRRRRDQSACSRRSATAAAAPATKGDTLDGGTEALGSEPVRGHRHAGLGIRRGGSWSTISTTATAANDALGSVVRHPRHGLGRRRDHLRCTGDSGGPNFINGLIAGVTSYGLELTRGPARRGRRPQFELRRHRCRRAGFDLRRLDRRGRCVGIARVPRQHDHRQRPEVVGGGDGRRRRFRHHLDQLRPGRHRQRLRGGRQRRERRLRPALQRRRQPGGATSSWSTRTRTTTSSTRAWRWTPTATS